MNKRAAFSIVCKRRRVSSVLCHAHGQTTRNQRLELTSRTGDNGDGRLHSATPLMSSIRYRNTGECLLTCYSCLFLPPLKFADTGLLSNTSGGYGQTLRHSFTCRRTWKAQELWRKKDNVLSLVFHHHQHR